MTADLRSGTQGFLDKDAAIDWMMTGGEPTRWKAARRYPFVQRSSVSDTNSTVSPAFSMKKRANSFSRDYMVVLVAPEFRAWAVWTSGLLTAVFS